LYQWFLYEFMGVEKVATTGELRAIIEELELIDIGDAASYLGEAYEDDEDLISDEEPDWLLLSIAKRAVERDK
jgi:hypothetical protein